MSLSLQFSNWQHADCMVRSSDPCSAIYENFTPETELYNQSYCYVNYLTQLFIYLTHLSKYQHT